MSTPSPVTRKLADPEDLRLSSLDEDSQPSKLFDHSDEEEAQPKHALLPEEKEKPKPKPGTSNGMLLIWIVINTLATIGIVCCP